MQPLRSTKIVATIGPATRAPETIRALVDAGVDVARLNFSHGTHAELLAMADAVRAASDAAGRHVAILGDTRGPEVRTGSLREAPVRLEEGQRFVLHTDGRPGDRDGVSVSYEGLPREVSVGQSIYLDDGSIQLRVEAVGDDHIVCRVVTGALLGERKGVTVPGVSLALPMLAPRDYADLELAARHGFDYVAASFVRSPGDVELVRTALAAHGAELPVIAKIEHPLAVERLSAIVSVADGTMVARGDLGVEMPVEKVPLVQKRIIRETVNAGKPVITATQMLDSMQRQPRPTRAEASDVANAILDGSSAVMLSGETAIGRHPLEAVRTMSRIALEAERGLDEFGSLQRHPEPVRERVSDAMAHAAFDVARRTKAAAILTLTETGQTSRAISKHRPGCPILAVSNSRAVVRRLSLNWGIVGLLHPGGDASDDEKIAFGIERARSICAEPGDPIVVTAGISRSSGSTNLVRVVRA